MITYSKSDIETLRTILLLTQFVALCPSRGSLWHLTGTALRLCIDIGLHWETEEQAVGMDPDLLNERRRLWYSTYQFDRILCITLGRPFGIIDESARVPLPNPWTASLDSINAKSNNFDVHSQRAHNHMFDLSKLESEIKHCGCSPSFPPPLRLSEGHFGQCLIPTQSSRHLALLISSKISNTDFKSLHSAP